MIDSIFVNKGTWTIQYDKGYFPNRHHRLGKYKGGPWATGTEETKLQVCEACSWSLLSHSIFTRVLVNVCIHDFDDVKEESNKAASNDKHLLQE